MPEDDAPVLDTLAEISAVSLERSGLDLNTLMSLRLAALVAVGAPAISYAANLDAAVEGGISLEQAQGVLIAVAPIVGTARVLAAVANIAEGIGLALAPDEDD